MSGGAEPNAGNGANFEHFSWIQTLADVSISVPVPRGTRGKQVDVKIARKSLEVGLKGQEPILKGSLTETVKEENCIWSMDDASIEISLQKTNTMHWWKAVLEGEPEINVQKVLVSQINRFVCISMPCSVVHVFVPFMQQCVHVHARRNGYEMLKVSMVSWPASASSLLMPCRAHGLPA